MELHNESGPQPSEQLASRFHSYFTGGESPCHAVMLLGMESTGALFTPFALHLRLLGRQSTTPGTTDATQYGTTRASPRTFYRHHTASIAAAVVFADAQTVLNAAASMSFELTLAPPTRPSPAP